MGEVDLAAAFAREGSSRQAGLLEANAHFPAAGVT